MSVNDATATCLYYCPRVACSLRQVQRTFRGPEICSSSAHFRPPRSEMASITALAHGDISDLCRPCVDCGQITGRFCDGLVNDCFAAFWVPSEQWQEGQRTPLCGPCENTHEACHFCRGVHSCRPFEKGKVFDTGAQVSLSQTHKRQPYFQ